MSEGTTIGISETMAETLNEEKQNGESYEDVIERLLALKKCPKCKEGEMKVTDASLWNARQFDLECENCGHKIKDWKLPLEAKK